MRVTIGYGDAEAEFDVGGGTVEELRRAALAHFKAPKDDRDRLLLHDVTGDSPQVLYPLSRLADVASDGGRLLLTFPL